MLAAQCRKLADMVQQGVGIFFLHIDGRVVLGGIDRQVEILGLACREAGVLAGVPLHRSA